MTTTDQDEHTRAHALRARAAARGAQAAALRERVRSVELKAELTLILGWLEDVEALWLAHFDDQRHDRRSRSVSLEGAEAAYAMADARVTMVKLAIAKHGDAVEALG